MYVCPLVVHTVKKKKGPQFPVSLVSFFHCAFCQSIFQVISGTEKLQHRTDKGCISEAPVIFRERSCNAKEVERPRQETHTSARVSHTPTNRHTRFRHGLALADMQQEWQRERTSACCLASFGGDGGRGKVTAFLDRAASACRLRGAPSSLACLSQDSAELPHGAGR